MGWCVGVWDGDWVGVDWVGLDSMTGAAVLVVGKGGCGDGVGT